MSSKIIFPTIEIDKNYILREITQNDVEDFFSYYSNPEVSQYVLSSIPQNTEEAKYELQYWINVKESNNGIYFAIAQKDSNRLIGTIGLTDYNRYHNRAEISYDLAKEFWNKGIISGAISKVIDYGFREMGLNRIEAQCLVYNIASHKVLEKNNFQKEGVLRQYRKNKDKYHDVVLLSILRQTIATFIKYD
jgi:ribosomal-protein-alanine N-acetyltransferase